MGGLSAINGTYTHKELALLYFKCLFYKVIKFSLKRVVGMRFFRGIHVHGSQTYAKATISSLGDELH